MDNIRVKIYKKGLSEGKIEKLEKFLTLLNKIYSYNLNIMILICIYVVLNKVDW